jgi:hypothetical protein
VADLAAADADEVMGFGRILQPCAQFASLRPDVVALHGAFPPTATAANPAWHWPFNRCGNRVFCFSERVAILDGNVKGC